MQVSKNGSNQDHNPLTGVRIGEASNPGPRRGRKPKVQEAEEHQAQGEVAAQEEETTEPAVEGQEEEEVNFQAPTGAQTATELSEAVVATGS
eukprot:891696-Heterocapsa_arctica.AAC.1